MNSQRCESPPPLALVAPLLRRGRPLGLRWLGRIYPDNDAAIGCTLHLGRHSRCLQWSGRAAARDSPRSERQASKCSVPVGEGRGAFLVSVLTDVAAAEVLQAGDVIVELDGRQVVNVGELIAAVQEGAPGDEVDIRITRADEEVTVTTSLAESPDQPGRPILGVKLEDRLRNQAVRRGRFCPAGGFASGPGGSGSKTGWPFWTRLDAAGRASTSKSRKTSGSRWTVGSCHSEGTRTL